MDGLLMKIEIWLGARDVRRELTAEGRPEVSSTRFMDEAQLEHNAAVDAAMDVDERRRLNGLIPAAYYVDMLISVNIRSN